MYTSALELAKQLKSRALTCKKVVEDTFLAIKKTESHFQANISLMEEQALEQAAHVDALYEKGETLPPLAGVPIAIKDNICIQGTRTTCSSKMLEHFVAPYTATVVEKIRQNHLIPVSKTNLDEFAMGSSTENSAFFTSKNPWDTQRVPGGSSGGSAAAVAGGQVTLALGSDTGGSIRQPAAFCGIVGFKPTYGWVSRYGLVAFASSLDQIGPFSRTVEDTAALMDVIGGHDSRDSTSSKTPIPSFLDTLSQPISGLKIGVPKELLSDMIQPEIKDALFKALDVYTSLGATWKEISISSFEAAVATYYVLAPAEASANLSRYDGVRYGFRAEGASTLKEMITRSRGEGFGPEVKRRIILGTYVLSSGYYDAYYGQAQKARQHITHDFNRTFTDCDVVMTPTTPTTAFKIGENSNNPLAMYLADIATIPANLAGLPGISIPCGFDSSNLPIGFQLVGKRFDDAVLLRAAHAYQQNTEWHKAIPSFVKEVLG
jgi:aspartyl-tRNA(Asn)/glutamyl-tRNA(Gln) amidotransferase subunit A